MTAQCDQQVIKRAGVEPYVTRHWKVAIEMCKTGDAAALRTWGARMMWAAVRAAGDAYFNTLGGTRKNDVLAGRTR
jgi:hypothetical protein